MEKNLGKLRGLLTLFCVGVGFFTTGEVKAEGSPIYYDSFYEDYYKAYPDKKPKEKAETKKQQQTQSQPVYYNGYDPYMQYQTNAMYSQTISPYASFYQSVEHPTKGWTFDVQYKKNSAHFMFRSDVGSILNWDEIKTKETIYKVSKDFMIKNRQYVFTAKYGKGSGETTRTSDDDIYNEAHIISLGAGSVDLSNWSVSLGLRNFWKLGTWDVTPYIGYKEKKTDFVMFDHATPSTYYLDYFCQFGDDEGVVTIGNDTYENVCSAGINLLDHLDNYDYWSQVMYYAEEDDEGNITKLSGTVDEADMFIPGFVEFDDGTGVVNLSAGDQIYQEDYCYTAESGNMVCIESGDDGTPLLLAFGGVSSIFIQDGITHMYFVTWSGPFVGVNLERKLSEKEDLNLYLEYFKPKYKVWGNWPNRTDWMHDPSFNDEGGQGMGYSFDLSYKYRLYNNLALTADINYEYLKNENATTILYFADGSVGVYPDAILLSRWKSYGLTLGLSLKF